MKKENKEKIKKLVKIYYENIFYGEISADSIEHSNELQARIFANTIINIIDIILEELNKKEVEK